MTLQEIFESAELNSAQLRPAISAITEAEQEISVSKAAMLPEIEAKLSLSYIGDGFTTKRDFSDYQKAPIPHLGTGLGVTVTQPVYAGGALTTGVRIAELKSSAARYAADMKRDNIRFQLTGFYLDLYRYHNLREVVASNIESAGKMIARMTEMRNQGVLLQNDITRYELLLSNLELKLTSIDNTIAILNNNLITVAGLPESTVVIPDSTILSRSLPDRASDAWVSTAMENSPAVSLASTGVALSRRGEDMTRSEMLPKIGLQAAWTLDGPILVEVPPIDRNLSYWYVGVGVSYNISSLYKSGRSMAKSRLATLRATEELAATREEIDMALRADHIRYLEAYERLKTCDKSAELSERNYHVISTRYSEGMALITDLLDAADARLSAQQELVDSRMNILYYYYKLLFISGTI
ncbi:MAG: TolC family protein [Bacteroides sp.]|nr:TolC family protein [Bacteroides sp.]